MTDSFVPLQKRPARIRKTDLLLLIGFSGIYLNKLPIEPPYIAFFFSLIYYGYITCANGKILKVTFVSVLLMFCFLCLFAGKGNPMSFVIHFSSLLMFPLIVEIGKNEEKQAIINISVSFIKLSILFLIPECIVRYIFGGLWSTAPSFYKYKVWSFMFVDSNLTAEFILVLYFFCIYLKIYHKTNTKAYRIILFMLCLLTFSRAAIASLALSWFFVFRIRKHDNFFRIFVFRSILVALMIFILYRLFFDVLYETDGSFWSKFYFFEKAQGLFVFNWDKVLFGTGLGTAKDFLQGSYPHNFFLLYFIEIGIVGIIMKIIYMVAVLSNTKMKGLLLVVPYFIAEQSVAAYTVHYLYVVLAVIALLERETDYGRHNNWRTALPHEAIREQG